MAENGIAGTVIAALLAAVSWLAKKLYDAPRPSEHERLQADCDKLRAIVDAAAVEAKHALAEREIEYRELEAKFRRLEATIALRTGSPDGQS